MSDQKPDFLKSQLSKDSNVGNKDQEKWKRYEAHEGIAFCIELTSSMYLPSEDLNGQIQLMEILDSLNELMSELVIVMPNTAIGCYFYNCAHPKAENNVYELIPLRDVNFQNMKKVNDLLDDIKSNRLTLEEEIPIADKANPAELSPALIMIREKFLEPVDGQKQLTNKKIFIFTDNDKPSEFQDVESRSRLRKVIDDLYDYHINFVTFFIGSKVKPFDNTTFADILRWGSKVNDTKYWLHSHGPNTKPINASTIKSKVKRTKEINRVKFRCPLILDERADFVVSVSGYTIISHEIPASKYKLIYDNGTVKQEAYSRREYLDAETGEVVPNDELAKTFSFGNEIIELSEEENSQIQNIYGNYDSFLKLIGFRSTEECLCFYNNIGAPSLVVPNEEQYKGSIKTLTSLYRTLKKKEKSAVIWGKLRPNSMASMFVLTPSSNEDFNQAFYLYRIPFIDEVRKLPTLSSYPELLESDDYQVLSRVTETLVNFFNLKNGYKPSDYHNPALQRHFTVLREYLLQIESKETKDQDEDDETLLKVKQIHERIAASAQSDDPKQQRLVKYLKLWNSYYNRYNNLEIESKPKQNKRSKFNI